MGFITTQKNIMPG